MCELVRAVRVALHTPKHYRTTSKKVSLPKQPPRGRGLVGQGAGGEIGKN